MLDGGATQASGDVVCAKGCGWRGVVTTQVNDAPCNGACGAAGVGAAAPVVDYFATDSTFLSGKGE